VTLYDDTPLALEPESVANNDVSIESEQVLLSVEIVGAEGAVVSTVKVNEVGLAVLVAKVQLTLHWYVPSIRWVLVALCTRDVGGCGVSEKLPPVAFTTMQVAASLVVTLMSGVLSLV